MVGELWLPHHSGFQAWLGKDHQGERMGRFIAALVGVVAGFALAHVVNQTPEGRAFFARARATVSSFVQGFTETYRH